jgi:hypothetical protein
MSVRDAAARDFADRTTMKLTKEQVLTVVTEAGQKMSDPN